jgi:hypothetical protein
METTPCAVAADTKLETPEGPATIRALAGKPAPVLTRTDEGQVRFAALEDVRSLGEAQPVWRVRLETGYAFRVGGQQVLFRKGMAAVSASELRPGDELEPCFAYPEGYAYRTPDGGQETSRGSVRVTAVEEAGTAEVFTFRVPLAGRFFFSAGVLGKAEGT